MSKLLVVTPTEKILSIPAGRQVYLYVGEDKVWNTHCTNPGLYKMDHEYRHTDLFISAYAKNYTTVQTYTDTSTYPHKTIAYTRWMVWDSNKWDIP